jgi:hypothetical protein
MRRLSKNGPPVTNSASGRSRPNVEKAMSMSRLVLALMTLICSPMVPAAVSKKLTPVALPPGLARLATRPSLTGSSGTVKTMGIVVVAALAACAAKLPAGVAITHATTHQVTHDRRKAMELALQPVVLDRYVLALEVAGFVEALAERGGKVRIG